MESTKEQMVKTIAEQPDDSSYEEILRELSFARMIQRGLEDSQAQRSISDQEMKHRTLSLKQRRAPDRLAGET